jgi:O-antigen/teichoic acid export membrane protein
MSRVRSNVVANIAGQSTSILLSLLCTPFYIKLLGIEAYGLLAFFLLVQTIAVVLDFGLGGTLTREVARHRAAVSHAEAVSFRSFVVTLERWYWTLGAALGLTLLFVLPEMVHWWLRPQAITEPEMTAAARTFALLAALQWPSVFYQSALSGMQRQVALNAINIPFATLGSLGGVLFIWLGPRSVAALLGWQAACACASLLVTYAYFWRNIGFERHATAARLDVLSRHWRFSAGLSGISVTGLILMHTDKLLLSRLLPLQAFAHYSLAVTVAKGLYVLISPVFSAYFPRLSSLAAKGDEDSLRACYHTATQLMAALILPLALVIAFFPDELARLWLRDAALAAEIGPLATWLVVGTCLNGLMNIPFALQLARGRTRIGLLINVALVALIVPSTIYAATQYGAIGGAAMWAILNAIYLAVGLPVTHRLLLRDSLTQWLTQDVLPPFVASLMVVVAARILLPAESGTAVVVVTLVVCWLLAAAAAFASARQTRLWVQAAVRNWSVPRSA